MSITSLLSLETPCTVVSTAKHLDDHFLPLVFFPLSLLFSLHSGLTRRTEGRHSQDKQMDLLLQSVLNILLYICFISKAGNRIMFQFSEHIKRTMWWVEWFTLLPNVLYYSLNFLYYYYYITESALPCANPQLAYTSAQLQTVLCSHFKRMTPDCFDRKWWPIPTSALSVHNLPTLGSVQANTVCTQCTMINPQIVYCGRNHSVKTQKLSFLSATWMLLLPSSFSNYKVL